MAYAQRTSHVRAATKTILWRMVGVCTAHGLRICPRADLEGAHRARATPKIFQIAFISIQYCVRGLKIYSDVIKNRIGKIS